MCVLRFPSALHMTKLFDTGKACVLKNLAKFAHLIICCNFVINQRSNSIVTSPTMYAYL